MEKTIIEVFEKRIAVIQSEEAVIIDSRSALDIMATIDYEDNCDRIAINKEAVAAEFFKLSSGLAGEILQKFINYSKKLAIYGDFSIYNSKPLHDFIYECNSGKDIFFVSTKEEAIKKLSE